MTLFLPCCFECSFFKAATAQINTPVYGECKRRNEFAEWHVAWREEWHNYAKYDLRGKKIN